MFVGRRQEIQELKALLTLKKSSFVVIKGRRRIGKSTLVRMFSRDCSHFYEFAGLAPSDKTTAITQKMEFTQLLARQGIPGVDSQDWSDIFWHLAQVVKKKRTVIFLDEISWMADKDETFLAKLKNAWDLYFSREDKIILIVCGSISSWIDKNLLSHSGFLGRVDLELTLKELSLTDCQQFFQSRKTQLSTLDKISLLSVTGGVPRYLEDIRPNDTAENNLLRMCFKSSGLLFNEFDKIFHDLFDKRAPLYKKILSSLIKGPQSLQTLLDDMHINKSGIYSDYLNDLVTAGFVSRDYTWNLNNGALRNLSRYRIRDNYVRFYLKYIEPHKQQIIKGDFAASLLAKLPQWSTIMGLQFENLILANRQHIFKYLSLVPEDILNDGPFYQTKTKLQEGCQIDFLIHTKSRNLFVCEIKRSSTMITKSIVDEVAKKIKLLKIPRFFSVRPVLIFCGQIDPELYELDFFDKIISADDLLNN